MSSRCLSEMPQSPKRGVCRSLAHRAERYGNKINVRQDVSAVVALASEHKVGYKAARKKLGNLYPLATANRAKYALEKKSKRPEYAIRQK